VEHYPIHGGSLRLFVEKHEAVGESVRSYLASEADAGVDQLSYYTNFASDVKGLKSTLKKMLIDLKTSGKKLAGYGAAAKGAIMLNVVGIGSDLIDFVVDRNVHKQGRYMPGDSIPILDPEAILKEMPDYVLLLPWNFKDEILHQQREYRNRGGKFIIPVPHPQIV